MEEVAGSEAGMTYDPMKANVTVTVTKDGHTLTATKALPTDTEFNNTFTPAATSAQFNFTKKLEGKALEADAFTFELLENGRVIQTKKNDVNGNIQFDAISYAAEGTHKYTVREVAGADTDIDYDSMNAEVTVNVTKNATTGALTANVTMPTDSEFNNYAVAPVTAQFDFSKALAGRTLKAGEFSFVLKDANGTVLQTKQNDAEGHVKFDALTFTNAQVGDYNYTVEEVIPETKEAGMTYDTMKANVTITVTKSGHALTAVTALPTDTEFNNTFKSSPVKVNLEFTKSLSNGTLNAGDFSFTLTGNNVNETVTNKADGKVNFSELSFDKVGVYNYTVKEVKGNKPDVDYDEMTIAVKVTVTKDEDSGLLVAKTEMTSTGGEATGTDDKTFNNYVIAPVKAQFNFTKKLDGRALKAGEFSFILKDEKGNVIETVSNNAEGKIKFSALEFKLGQEGTYIYHVEEVKGTEAGIEYDKMVATVGITVTKDGKVLTLTSQMPEDTEFNNRVTPPTPPTPEKPKGSELPNTGEQSKSGVVALGVALGLASLVLLSKRREEDEI